MKTKELKNSKIFFVLSAIIVILPLSLFLFHPIFFPPTENIILNCTEDSVQCTKESRDDIKESLLITDSSNYVKSPFTNKKYEVEVLDLGLIHPWDFEFFSDSMFVTLKNGSIFLYNFSTRGLERIDDSIISDSVKKTITGFAIDRDFEKNHQAFICYILFSDVNYSKVKGRQLSKILIEDKKIVKESLIADIPAGEKHDGCRLKFGPDGKLYVSAGDSSSDPELKPQNITYLSGKILRLNKDGTVPSDNPFGDSYVYSYGHRNPQGLAWDPITKKLFATEHGPTKYDEINIIEKGGNYGWPIKVCDEFNYGNGFNITDTKKYSSIKFENPVRCYKEWTIAPSEATFIDDPQHPWFRNLFVTALRGKHLHRFVINDKGVVTDEIFYINTMATNHSRRLRDVEFYNGSLWVLGDYSGIFKLTPN